MDYVSHFKPLCEHISATEIWKFVISKPNKLGVGTDQLKFYETFSVSSIKNIKMSVNNAKLFLYKNF